MQPSIGILLRELARLYTQAQRDQVTSGHDTSSTQSHVLIELGRAGLLTQHELGRRLSLDKGWVSRAVDSLVQSGLITKTRHENDRRSRWLQLTRKGTERYQALNEALDAHAEQLMQPLAPEQRTSIYQALVLLLNGLQSALPQEVEAVAAPLAATDAPQLVATPVQAAGSEEPEAVPGTSTAVTEAAVSVAEPEPVAVQPQEEAISQEVAPLAAKAPEPIVADAPAEPLAKPAIEKRPTSRLGQPDAPTRIIGSKTLPIRPLLSSRAQPRTPLSRAAHQAEQKNTTPADETPMIPATPATTHEMPRTPTRPLTVPTVSRAQASATVAAHPAIKVQSPSATPAVRPAAITPQIKPVAAPVPEPHVSPASPARQNGSLFHKLLSQGSLFNKLLQRDQEQEEVPESEAPPVEVEPEDNLLFQAAYPSDWNEIRNLLTANRLPVQGALNHLSNFVVATENGRVVGALGLEVYGDVGLLRSLVVASNMRGRSIAKRLIKHMILRSREKQLGALYLLAGKTDALFERHGFEKMPRADMPTKLYVSMELQGPSSTASTGMRLIL